MSSGRECEVIEFQAGRWAYLLESNTSSKWDWRDGADLYGPFSSEISASDHLTRHHSNPGGYAIVSCEKVGAELKTVIQAAFSSTSLNPASGDRT